MKQKTFQNDEWYYAPLPFQVVKKILFLQFQNI